MKKWKFFATALVTSAMLFPQLVLAQTTQEDPAIAQEESAAEATKDSPKWVDNVKAKYNLTDAQIQTMKDKGISGPQMAMTANLAEKSGKSIDDVLRMRTEDKMGWGKIAKELGVSPKEIGQSVAGMHREVKEDKAEAKLGRSEAKLEKQQAKLEKQEARLEKKREKQEAKREKREGHKTH